MENYSFNSSSSDSSSHSIPSLPQAQPIPFAEGQGDDWSFQDFLGVLRRRTLVIVGVTITMMTTVVVNLTLNQKPPEYEGNFQLLVEPVTDDARSVDIVKDNSSGNSAAAGLDYESQIQVLKSPALMGSIIRTLQISYPDISYNSLINSLTITQLNETKIIEVRYRSNDPNKIKTVLDRIAEEYIDYSQEKRQTKLRQGIRFVDKELPSIRGRVDRLQKELQMFRQKYDFVDPDKQVSLITEQVTVLTNQRQNIAQELAKARADLAILQGKNGRLAALINAPLYQQLLAQLQQLDVQIATESIRLQDVNPTLQTLKEKRESLLPLVNQEAQRVYDVKLAEIVNQIQNLEVQSQEIAKTEQRLEQKRKQWPILARQYTELQRTLQVATESLNRFLSTRETLQIQVSQTELGWQLLQPPTKPENPVYASDFKRNLIVGLVASILLGIGAALLLEKLDNTYHNVQALKDKVKLPLLGNIPFEQQIKNHQDRAYIHAQQNKSKLPLLGNNPFERQIETSQNRSFTQKAPIVAVHNHVSEGMYDSTVESNQDYNHYSPNFLEALRVLYTNIQLLSSDRQIRSITISSATLGDGKSTVAFHLAQIATAMGQRVLLIDADLRQPAIHTLSDLNNLWGLSNLISTNLPVQEVIRKLPSMNQLSVITAGPIPPDPTKLLSSEKMKRLMADFHNTFDLVIYDVPHLVGLADASLLAPHTDGLLMVVRIDKTDSSVLNQALDNLKFSRLNVLGVVGNGQKINFNS
ncbi:polysaccharide biosynthesis tyrosine autokinase [Nostocaceae cyanobacterium CENA357]|uniref:Polysaccharide biosynthesis tyrosine autokinase n=1 Tax=Atlanticothrix silvestris CENA357 TaxID=1725252 RepID=A0A8J7HM16_9CYAN|nr:polysaccharide biosynthesis tyrosine autokinase [Atlanticothrix silvestris]MBH8555288.1 polysaccharide biosynthesis tyrosine autokinase [Atlanticothrix silvestris CENA357]